LFAGLQILAARQMSPGDYVKLDGGYEGFVVDITWRNTTIRDLSDNLIVVPNDKLGAAIFTNYSVPDHHMTVSAEAFAAYGEDLAKTSRIALEVARSVVADMGGGAQEPYVRYQQITEMGILLAAYFSVGRFVDRFEARSLFFERFYTRCAKEGVALTRQPFAEKK